MASCTKSRKWEGGIENGEKPSLLHSIHPWPLAYLRLAILHSLFPIPGPAMKFSDILRTAIFALRGNWMRSALTSLGVIIGIAAVIVMVSVGQGTQAEIDKMVSGLGSQRLDISPGASRGAGGGVRMSSASFFTLNEGDVDAIRNEIPEVQYVAGALRGNTQVIYAENNASTSWQGVQPDFFDINSWTIADGEGFDAQDYTGADKVVILGETVRRTLFGEESGVGQTIRVGRVPFTVVGTLKPKGQGGFGQDQDDVMMVPLQTARRRLMGAMGLPAGAVMQIALTVANATTGTVVSTLTGSVSGVIAIVMNGKSGRFHSDEIALTERLLPQPEMPIMSSAAVTVSTSVTRRLDRWVPACARTLSVISGCAAKAFSWSCEGSPWTLSSQCTTRSRSGCSAASRAHSSPKITDFSSRLA